MPAPDGTTKGHLSVGLGDTLELVLLLDGVRVRGALGGVDKLVSKALRDGLRVVESRLAGADGEEGDSLVDTAEGRDVDSLATDGTLRTDTGRVFPGAGVDDGVNKDLDGVLLGDEVDDLESVLNDADGHDLLAVVAAVHHKAGMSASRNTASGSNSRVDETLDNGHAALGELLLGVAASSVGDVDSVADVDVVSQRDVLDLNTVSLANALLDYQGCRCSSWSGQAIPSTFELNDNDNSDPKTPLHSLAHIHVVDSRLPVA